MYSKETRYSGLPLMIWEEDENVELQFLVSNYCFPHNWPSSDQQQEIRKDSTSHYIWNPSKTSEFGDKETDQQMACGFRSFD